LPHIATFLIICFFIENVKFETASFFYRKLLFQKATKFNPMKYSSLLFIVSFFLFSTNNFAQQKTMDKQSIYQFTVKDIEGNDFNFADLKGKKILVVNTASECGYTGQYENLEKLYQEYKDQDFVIVGFPANNFGGQEPGSNKTIASFCKANYGVSFPMMSKISVKGEDEHPLYQFLTQKSKNGEMDSEVKWNFQKYLIDEEGHVSGVYESKV